MPPASVPPAQVSSLTNFAGLYLHIPFCRKKCAYCDFYSSFATEELIDRYVSALIREIEKRGGPFGRPVDSIYFGGGTPSLLGERVEQVLDAVRRHFTLSEDLEITAEANPTAADIPFLKAAKRSGVNRLSFGVQSGLDEELKILGRNHTAEEARETFFFAREMGFQNISVDLMLGLPDSTEETLSQSLDFIKALDPEHISTYLLKIEPNTKFYKTRDQLHLPDEDAQAEQYLQTCRFLENLGYRHYEISNFSKEGFESHHNLKYWQGDDYLGLGPAAHSFVGGKRFYFPRDLKAFLGGADPMTDGAGGDFEETVLLRLRLSDGLDLKTTADRFGVKIPKNLWQRLEQYVRAGLGSLQNTTFSLTDTGMLVSNQIISDILEEFAL